jgi:hypothetical protein
MWGTDGVRIETVDDGWVWVFSAVDHCDACCVGIHTVKTGNRFAALQPIAQGLLGEPANSAARVPMSLGPDPAYGSRLPIDYGRRLPQPGQVLRCHPKLRFRRRVANEWRCRALQPDAERTGHSSGGNGT